MEIAQSGRKEREEYGRRGKIVEWRRERKKNHCKLLTHPGGAPAALWGFPPGSRLCRWTCCRRARTVPRRWTVASDTPGTWSSWGGRPCPALSSLDHSEKFPDRNRHTSYRISCKKGTPWRRAFRSSPPSWSPRSAPVPPRRLPADRPRGGCAFLPVFRAPCPWERNGYTSPSKFNGHAVSPAPATATTTTATLSNRSEPRGKELHGTFRGNVSCRNVRRRRGRFDPPVEAFLKKTLKHRRYRYIKFCDGDSRRICRHKAENWRNEPHYISRQPHPTSDKLAHLERGELGTERSRGGPHEHNVHQPHPDRAEVHQDIRNTMKSSLVSLASRDSQTWSVANLIYEGGTITT